MLISTKLDTVFRIPKIIEGDINKDKIAKKLVHNEELAKEEARKIAQHKWENVKPKSPIRKSESAT
jgi:hypothetical protein